MDKHIEESLFNELQKSLQLLRDAKPTERNEKARRYAVTITELEKVVAYFQVYVLGD